jgi:hypothetical protein
MTIPNELPGNTPASVPVFAPAPRPAPRPEPETADENIGDGEDDMDLGEEQEAPKKTVDDGISDLFDTEETEDIDDLFEVTDGDIIGDEDGDISDLFEVKNEDIMGRRPKMRPKTGRPFRSGGGEGMQGVGY